MSDGSWGGDVPSDQEIKVVSWCVILQGVACGGRVSGAGGSDSPVFLI